MGLGGMGLGSALGKSGVRVSKWNVSPGDVWSERLISFVTGVSGLNAVSAAALVVDAS